MRSSARSGLECGVIYQARTFRATCDCGNSIDVEVTLRPMQYILNVAFFADNFLREGLEAQGWELKTVESLRPPGWKGWFAQSHTVVSTLCPTCQEA